MQALLLSLLVLGQGAPSAVQKPAWVTTQWAEEDRLKDAWAPYAKTLKVHPGYQSGTDLPARAKAAIAELPKNLTELPLYRASAQYIVARAVDWSFDPDPLTSPTFGKLARAWLAYTKPTESAEFSRMGFAVCSLLQQFDADDMPRSLLVRFRNDRLVIRGLVAYERTRIKDLKRSTWVLEQAKRLVTFPDRRPQDYMTLAQAYGAHFWSTNDLKDAIGARDALVKMKASVPKGFQAVVDRDLQAAEKYIRNAKGG